MALVRQLNTNSADWPEALEQLRFLDESASQQLSEQVAAILKDVKQTGDAALIRYNTLWDGRNSVSLRLQPELLSFAWSQMPQQLQQAIEVASKSIRAFHERQKEKSWHMDLGNNSSIGQRVTAIESVGLYVPGGRAAYPSSVMMNAIPAQVAGVSRIAVVMPLPEGAESSNVALATMHFLGLSEVYAVGGAQAIAALTFGTETIAPVHKVVGPGNAYVAEAKRQVFGRVGIDNIAGPSEVVIIADDSAHPEWVASDLIAQAEHDPLAQAILLTPSQQFAAFVIGSKCFHFDPIFERSRSHRRSIRTRAFGVSSARPTCFIAKSASCRSHIPWPLQRGILRRLLCRS